MQTSMTKEEGGSRPTNDDRWLVMFSCCSNFCPLGKFENIYLGEEHMIYI